MPPGSRWRNGVVAVLEVQWGSPVASKWFRINHLNHSGRRLIKLVGHSNFVVTNACPDAVMHARQRGTPDAAWLASNLQALQPRVTIVCGAVARKTFSRRMVPVGSAVVYIPHPAARTWTKESIAHWAAKIQKLTGSYDYGSRSI